MEEDIPWLDSAELVEADGEPAVVSTRPTPRMLSHNQDSLVPLELATLTLDEVGADLPALPKRRNRAVIATLGVLGSAVTVLAVLAGPTPVSVSASAAHPAAPVPSVAPATPAAPVQTLAAAPVQTTPSVQAPLVASTPKPVPASPAAVASANVRATSTTSSHRSSADASEQRDSASTRSTDTRSADTHTAATPDGLRAAFACLNSGRPQEALIRARAILKVTPQRADAWLVLGSAYDALHDRQAAQAAFRSCAERGRGPAVASCKQLTRD